MNSLHAVHAAAFMSGRFLFAAMYLSAPVEHCFAYLPDEKSKTMG